MKKTTRVKPKIIGRPRTGITPLMGFRADPVIRASIVRWAEKQPDNPTLSEAIRRLVELGLTVRIKREQAPARRDGRAKELASKAIDKMALKAPEAEKSIRKRRLLTGPEEFREHRVDLPKTKFP
jgi:hypothetical protein